MRNSSFWVVLLVSMIFSAPITSSGQSPLHPDDSLGLHALANALPVSGPGFVWPNGPETTDWPSVVTFTLDADGLRATGVSISDTILGNATLSGTIPLAINNITELTWLVLSHGENITGLAGPLSLPQLMVLKLEHNGIASLMDLTGLPSLGFLDVSYNNLNTLPNVSGLGGLYHLDCSHNSISLIPALPPGALLTELLCGNNSLAQLPDLSNYASSLFTLQCDSNSIATLPMTGNFVALRNLMANDNVLTNLPSIGQFPLLQRLDVRNNRLAQIDNLNQALQVQVVRLDGNTLRRLPAIQPLTSLDTFTCSNNGLQSLPNFPAITLDLVDVSENFLTFEDFIGANISATQFVYAPQNCMPGREMFAKLGESATLTKLYPVAVEDAQTQFQWFFEGAPIAGATSVDLSIAAVDAGDLGTYELEATHPSYPDLTWRCSMELKVVPADVNEFDPTSIIVRIDDDATPEQVEEILHYYEVELGLPRLDTCECDRGDNPRLLLYGLEGEGIFDPNSGGTGEKSGVGADETGLNFFVGNRGYTSKEQGRSCNILRPPVKTHRAVVALIDTGVNDEESPLARFRYTSNETSRLCQSQDNFAGFDFVSDAFEFVDDAGHGTHEAGIIASNLPEGVHVDILDLKTIPGSTGGTLFNVLCGLHYAIESEVDVINFSMGYRSQLMSPLLHEALAKAGVAEIPVVISAGNDKLFIREGLERRRWPAEFKKANDYNGVKYQALGNLISVAALNQYETAVDTLFSNRGADYVDVAAPGTGIASTDYEHPDRNDRRLSGTSMAAAHVSRIVGVVRAIDTNLRVDGIVTLLQNHIIELPNGEEWLSWKGKIDERALYLSLGIDPSALVPEEIFLKLTPEREKFCNQLRFDISPIDASIPAGSYEYEYVIFDEDGQEVLYGEGTGSSFVWDGTNQLGVPVPPGRYNVSVSVEKKLLGASVCKRSKLCCALFGKGG